MVYIINLKSCNGILISNYIINKYNFNYFKVGNFIYNDFYLLKDYFLSDKIIINFDNISIWLKNGNIHNEKGFAIDYKNGLVRYCLNNQEYTHLDWKQQCRLLKLKCILND